MRTALLTLFVFVYVLASRANDTLSNARVYNMNVGDTFDYKTIHKFTGYPTHDYYEFDRFVVVAKHLSIANDTLFVERHNVIKGDTELLAIANPDSFAYENYIEYLDCNHSLTVTDSVYNRRMNFVTRSCFESYSEFKVCEGLGEVYADARWSFGFGDNGTWIKELIYYSGPTGNSGIPYTELTGEDMHYYIPLPEECAVWTNEITYPSGSVYPYGVQEQIRTGNKIARNGHAYIELLYTCYNYRNSRKTTDSLIGHFRNDTVGRKVMWNSDFSQPDYPLYDFAAINGTYWKNSHVIADTITINNQVHTIWRYGSYMEKAYIGGIGDSEGLIPVLYGNWPFSKDQMVSKSTCFSVCGQTIYPEAATGNCAAITSINDPGNTETKLEIYPTIASDILTVNNGLKEKLNYVISSLTGQIMATGNLDGTGKIEVALLPNGIYLLQLHGEKLSAGAVKFVVSR